jgi:chemotaxis protein MotB
VVADRLGIIGWGEVRPKADNTTVEGRNQNRRVVVVVMSNRPTPKRDQSDPRQVAEVAALEKPAAATVDALPTVRVQATGTVSDATPPREAGKPEHSASTPLADAQPDSSRRASSTR